jgi:hypothetical protein
LFLFYKFKKEPVTPLLAQKVYLVIFIIGPNSTVKSVPESTYTVNSPDRKTNAPCWISPTTNPDSK